MLVLLLYHKHKVMVNVINRITLYGCIGFFFTALSFWLFSAFNKTLEEYLIGHWDEKHWEYKTADKYLLKGLGLEKFSESVATGGRQHTGEKWLFNPNGKLQIHTTDTVNHLSWSLKGRGNILEITDGSVTEHFEIKKYGSDKMELHFISDIQIKEAAIIIFDRVDI
jgi:hypothetical protein